MIIFNLRVFFNVKVSLFSDFFNPVADFFNISTYSDSFSTSSPPCFSFVCYKLNVNSVIEIFFFFLQKGVYISDNFCFTDETCVSLRG